MEITTQQALDSMPFCKAIGVEFVSVSPEEVRARLPWTEDGCTIGGALHGGALMTLADGAGAVTAFLNLPEGALGTTTVAPPPAFCGRCETAGPRRSVALSTEDGPPSWWRPKSLTPLAAGWPR